MNLRLVPKEGDALLLANLEVKWKNQIRKQRDIDERKRKREKELRQQEEVARLAEMKNKVYLLSLATGETEVSQSVRLMRTRMARINLEAQEVREEIDRVEGFERREKVRIKIEEMRNELGGKLSRADALVMARSLDMKLQLDEAIAKREGRQEELFAKRQKELRRIKFLEDTLRENEVQMTTPRSLLRRKLIRRMHVAMKRQQEGFMICEWGCHDWFKVGIDQIDHQQRKCLKRIIPCALGCETRHTEEYWLSEYKKPEPEVDLITPRDDDDESVASSTHGDVSVALGVVTNQQHHETKECRKRLVLCPLNCLEWVRFEELEHHKADLCTKRPAQPIACRLGCGCMFGGLVETLIQAEDERLEHESEQCEYRLVRCNWTYEDGTMCAAQMKANERAEHRDYHLTLQGVKTYSVPGIYQFRVTKSTTRLKVQLWGGGGGSGKVFQFNLCRYC